MKPDFPAAAEELTHPNHDHRPRNGGEKLTTPITPRPMLVAPRNLKIGIKYEETPKTVGAQQSMSKKLEFPTFADRTEAYEKHKRENPRQKVAKWKNPEPKPIPWIRILIPVAIAIAILALKAYFIFKS
jgi:hypothetical protein